ncbi:hypothetical protein [uncultured Mycolicibacterium sp.]|uniref:hypothetical protein n=1 Tax=uncultured Mycolicibacterium sp. TaxID=2320817 RepID=UPI0032B2A99D
MTKFTIVTAAATGLSVAVLALAAPAVSAPSGAGNAQETISKLEAEGNRVIVNKQCSAPLADKNVVRVRPGPPIREWVWSNSGSRRNGDNTRSDRVLETVGYIFFVDVA